MTRLRITIVLGTRPEAIKMAPVYLRLAEDRRTDVTLVATAQHREMLDQVLSVFGITPDVDLDLMQPNQTLAEVSARVVTGVQAALARLAPDAVLVHGDTSTCLFAALAAFYQRIPVGHVEAGLRTYDFDAPWPEEMNRRLTDPICRWCFVPTARARENLLAESIPDDNIVMTGNTVVDALLIARDRARRQPPAIPGLSDELLAGKRLVLVTGHRRESFGRPFEEFCFALREIVRRHDDVVLIYPVHLNPNVQQPVYKILEREERVYLIPPLEYLSFVSLMDRSYMIITDSGGIQEEAPSLAKPVLVTRDTTERPEAVAAGLAMLVGTSRQRIVAEAGRLLSDREAYARMSHGQNPYGDGRAAHRIVDSLCESLGRPTLAKQPVSLAAPKGCGS
jgi:UDP-N-acetylglucosamine 2-epimerase (hydrolysing)